MKELIIKYPDNFTKGEVYILKIFIIKKIEEIIKKHIIIPKEITDNINTQINDIKIANNYI